MATPLDSDARSSFATEHPDWDMDDETIRRTLTFDDFADAMGFVVRLALAAEAADHHPDIDIRWNRVTLALTTHSADALTDKDAALAAAIDSWLD